MEVGYLGLNPQKPTVRLPPQMRRGIVAELLISAATSIIRAQTAALQPYVSERRSGASHQEFDQPKQRGNRAKWEARDSSVVKFQKGQTGS